MDVQTRCVCPPKADGSPRHEGDTITLRDTLGFVATQTARNAIHLARSDAREQGVDLDAAYALAVLTEQYLMLGIAAWSLVDEKGKSLPVNRVTVRAFMENPDADDVVSFVADEADGLYAGKVMLPLLRTAASSSQPTPTASTSPTRGNGKAPAKPSRRSSISTIPTDATATTSKSRAGDSSSSRSSVSAA
jgi:hypothetical protein